MHCCERNRLRRRTCSEALREQLVGQDFARESEVDKLELAAVLDVTLVGEDVVLGLDVTVSDALLMAVRDRLWGMACNIHEPCLLGYETVVRCVTGAGESRPTFNM